MGISADCVSSGTGIDVPYGVIRSSMAFAVSIVQSQTISWEGDLTAGQKDVIDQISPVPVQNQIYVLARDKGEQPYCSGRQVSVSLTTLLRSASLGNIARDWLDALQALVSEIFTDSGRLLEFIDNGMLFDPSVESNPWI